jgi:thymidylate synthase ThyX
MISYFQKGLAVFKQWQKRRAFEKLKHAARPLPNGGMVLILNTGALIGQEAEAMLQALYSRSPGSVLKHLVDIARRGAEKFMGQYYVGYGDKSIGDCGTVTIFFEGVSMLTAKAIQDWLLYSGQEVSTRYVDFAEQPFINPTGLPWATEFQENLRLFYLDSLEPLKQDLMLRFPKPDNEDSGKYKKAIAARAFDILRGFLPAGAMTNLSWHANLRQTADKIALLRHHPLQEVRTAAEAMESALREAFPSSFSHKRYDEKEEYNEMWMSKYYYWLDEECPEFEGTVLFVDEEELKKYCYTRIFEGRPQKTELPKFLAQSASLKFRFLLDFASFRDIQRQRSVVQRMPFLTTMYGFEPWYLEELPSGIRDKATALLKTIDVWKIRSDIDPLNAQYCIPMGYHVPNRITGDLPAMVYVAELRATPFVHPTLQKQAHRITKFIEEHFGKYGLKVYTAKEIGLFDIKRGEQDIVKKAV